ncbi:hypothetical protein GCM10018793_28010 [Streptomyces sulfonofaciens]|uniref:DUF4229 domain-containing protein n=1 Tax=Streptomyces sulfonofaciens TaxID=68272 RepID=A0A919G4Z4_9ACTN|nr:DUF4229 domain-containing protein [Streptomyces sulfonofaciens]GHH78182.1 hypothetical protein GCM10018793_28010 [Streptomyces sulfonofaciens]
MLRYTLMRLGIFAGCFLAVWALVVTGVVPRGLGGSNYLWVALLALVVSAPISFVALRKERDRASERIVARVDRAKASMERSASQEDAADDAARAQGAQGGQAQGGRRAQEQAG